MIPQWLASFGGDDPFLFFRFLLVLFGTFYTLLRGAESLIRLVNLLYRPGRRYEVLRHYVVVQLLRVRFRRFGWDYLHIAGLIAIMVFVIWLHRFV